MRFIEPDALYAEPVDQRLQSLVDVAHDVERGRIVRVGILHERVDVDDRLVVVRIDFLRIELLDRESDGDDQVGTGISATSSGGIRQVAPGRLRCATEKALRMISGTETGVAIMLVHCVIGRNTETRSTI